jgi:HemY protein
VSFYRTLLWWLALAALGALAWDLLARDLGEVVIRWHGYTARTTVAFAIISLGLVNVGLWALWTLLRLPFLAWREHAQRQARNRLVNGLIALHEGRNGRAEALLVKATDDDDAGVVARVAAREAAARRGDLLAAAQHQSELLKIAPAIGSLATADVLIGQGQPAEALSVLQPFVDDKTLGPRGQLLRGEALVATGRAHEAIALLDGIRAGQGLSAEAAVAIERRWHAAAIMQSPDANELTRRWQVLPARLLETDDLVASYADRAAALGLEADAATALADALDRQWSDARVLQFAALPAPRDDARLARTERWLLAQPTNAALSLAIGRLSRQRQLWGKADDFLHRAIAQGAGADAWEELGHIHTAQQQADAAQTSYANALRVARGEPELGLSGRSLREQIAAEAAPEQRNEHGMPHLPR